MIVTHTSAIYPQCSKEELVPRIPEITFRLGYAAIKARSLHVGRSDLLHLWLGWNVIAKRDKICEEIFFSPNPSQTNF